MSLCARFASWLKVVSGKEHPPGGLIVPALALHVVSGIASRCQQHDTHIHTYKCCPSPSHVACISSFPPISRGLLESGWRRQMNEKDYFSLSLCLTGWFVLMQEAVSLEVVVAIPAAPRRNYSLSRTLDAVYWQAHHFLSASTLSYVILCVAFRMYSS